MKELQTKVASFPLQKRTNLQPVKSPRHPMTTFAYWHPRNNLLIVSETKTPSSLKVTKPSQKLGFEIQHLPVKKVANSAELVLLFWGGKRVYYPIASMGLLYSTLLTYHKNQQNVRFTSFMDPMGTTKDVQMRKSPLNSLTAPCPNRSILFYRLQVKNFGLQPDIAQFFTKHLIFYIYSPRIARSYWIFWFEKKTPITIISENCQLL